MSRLITTLASDVDTSFPAIREARAQARAAVWARRRPLAGRPGHRDGGLAIVDLDATLVTAHSEKENAGPTYQRGFGFAPTCAFVDHGEHGTGETLALDLRPGKARPFDSADHIDCLDAALAAPSDRTSSGGWSAPMPAAAPRPFCTTSPTWGWSTRSDSPARGPSRRRSRPSRVRMSRRRRLRRPAPRQRSGGRPHPVDADPDQADPFPGQVRTPSTGSEAMRVIARRERPTGAQIRLTDQHGWRITCFATNTHDWSVTDPEVRHRQRARAEDRIRALKDTGMRNTPFHGYAQNQIWLEIVALATDLLAWMKTLA